MCWFTLFYNTAACVYKNKSNNNIHEQLEQNLLFYTSESTVSSADTSMKEQINCRC